MSKPEQRGESKDRPQESKTKPTQGANAKQVKDSNAKQQSAQSSSKASGQPRYDDRPDAVKPDKGQTSLPRYDDQPKKTRTNEKQSGGADVPDYGDQESGDPRSSEIFD